MHQRFDLERLTQPWLPTAFNPVAISVRGSVVRYDPEGQFLVAPSGTYKGYSYEVDSELVVPSPQDLNLAVAPTGPTVARYTALPSTMPPQIAAIAHRWTDNQPTMYLKVLAIQNRLLRFRYDIRVNGPLSNMSQFSAAYGCKEGDPMVRPPDRRCQIW